VAERAVARAFRERSIAAVVRSAGTRGGLPNDPKTIRAALEVGLDLRDHVSRLMTVEIIENDGADLVIAMARLHAREVIALVPTASSRTFTLKELARRVRSPRSAGGDTLFADWRDGLAAERRVADLLGSDPDDDVPDPHGRRYGRHRDMVAEVDELAKHVAQAWRH
jgi:protein-tyrosine phosphatase